MGLARQLLKYMRGLHSTSPTDRPFAGYSEPQLLTDGWDRFAREWDPEKSPVLPGHRVQYLGDEWTVEDPSVAGSSYGLSADVVARFSDYLGEALLDRHLPAGAEQGLEIGPGGGRLTALLTPRTKVLHLADSSEAMLNHLKKRFARVTSLKYYQTDGMTVPPLPPASLDYVIAFDVFVHFEPRLVYWYLRQIGPLLKPGGKGILHYANALTPLGWRQFERHLEANLKRRTFFGAFGVMCPQLMEKFLEALRLEVVSSDLEVIPRDAVAVFRKPASG